MTQCEKYQSGSRPILERRGLNSIGQTRRVLVIDESETERARISKLLTDAGFEVFELSSAIGATRRLVRHQIHALVADLSLPGLSGGALVSVLRSNPRLSELAVLLLGRVQTDELKRIEREQAVTAVLDKEEVEERLVLVLQRALLRERTRKLSPLPNLVIGTPDGACG